MSDHHFLTSVFSASTFYERLQVEMKTDSHYGAFRGGNDFRLYLSSFFFSFFLRSRKIEVREKIEKLKKKEEMDWDWYKEGG